MINYKSEKERIAQYDKVVKDSEPSNWMLFALIAFIYIVTFLPIFLIESGG
jgi:hypothetical protein